MKPKKLLFLTLLGTLLVLVASSFYLINVATVRRIRVGMSVQQVEAIMGRPADSRKSTTFVAEGKGLFSATQLDWFNDGTVVSVYVSDDHVVYLEPEAYRSPLCELIMTIVSKNTGPAVSPDKPRTAEP